MGIDMPFILFDEPVAVFDNCANFGGQQLLCSDADNLDEIQEGSLVICRCELTSCFSALSVMAD